MRSCLFACLLTVTTFICSVSNAQPIVYEGTEGPGKGKHIVFLAGDEEYRSEETQPALARILAKHHGFKCTVLFSVNPETGYIDPDASNVPGLEALKTADLCVMFWRFRHIPKEQMQHVLDYIDRAGPIVGLRTSTHPFNYPKDSEFYKYSWNYKGKDLPGGFGQKVFGMTWMSHYGTNHVMSTRMPLIKEMKSHPIMKGIEKAPWVEAGGYWTAPKDSQALTLSIPLQTMKQDAPVTEGKEYCPGAWIRNYKNDEGKSGRVFATSYGASEDLQNEEFRRLLVNGIFWSAGLEDQIKPDLKTCFVGSYQPTTFGFRGYRRFVKPSDLEDYRSPIMSHSNPVIKVPRKRSKKKKTTELSLKKGDHICLVGNALGERMQHQNYWETLLHQRFPLHNLVVRNLCFPGDAVDIRPRSLDFGAPEVHLTHSKANVVLYFFGFNESFDGEKGIAEFKKDLEELIKKTKSQKFDGENPPRIAFVSPIPAEDVADKNVKDGVEHNKMIKAYSNAIKQVAAKHKVAFANVYDSMKKEFEKSKEQLTLNGIHLNSKGYQVFGKVLNDQLFGGIRKTQKLNGKLKSEVDDKNFHWWHRYRAVNGFSIYGKRGLAGTDGTYNNRDVMERERAVLDEMTAVRDERVWKTVQGLPVSAKPDDSKTLPFINPKSNVGTKNEPKGNDKKRGSLEYISAEEQLKSFKLKDGYMIELVASEEEFPELANPLAMNFDDKGRLWVSVLPSYPHWKPKSEMADKLLIFEDSNGDGKADSCKTFATGLHQPTGFEFGHGGVYVAVQPDLLFLKDTDGDDVADSKIRKVIGFGTADSHHGLGAFEWSPGGTLHSLEGLFKFSGIETSAGPIRTKDGAVWSYKPRTEDFGIHSRLQITNPWGHVFNDYGLDFITDGTSGKHYYMPPATGHHDLPNRANRRKFPVALKKVMRPCPGVEIVSSKNFLPEDQGDYLVNNVIGLLGTMQFSLKDDGSGKRGDFKGNLLESTYANFRPVDLQFGPDGALYILDWNNALIGHLQHNLRDPNRDHSHGRIWRIRHKERPLSKPVVIDGASTDELCKMLSHPEARVRYRVRRTLAAKKTQDVISSLDKWLKKFDVSNKDHLHQMLEGLWVQQSQVSIDEKLLNSLLTCSDFRVRAAATRVLCDCRDKFPNALETFAKQVNDKHPRVRLEAVRACSYFRTPDAAEIALQALEYEMDEFLEYTLAETMKQLEQF